MSGFLGPPSSHLQNGDNHTLVRGCWGNGKRDRLCRYFARCGLSRGQQTTVGPTWPITVFVNRVSTELRLPGLSGKGPHPYPVICTAPRHTPRFQFSRSGEKPEYLLLINVPDISDKVRFLVQILKHPRTVRPGIKSVLPHFPSV